MRTALNFNVRCRLRPRRSPAGFFMRCYNAAVPLSRKGRIVFMSLVSAWSVFIGALLLHYSWGTDKTLLKWGALFVIIEAIAGLVVVIVRR
jgi:hypothetical protein